MFLGETLSGSGGHVPCVPPLGFTPLQCTHGCINKYHCIYSDTKEVRS